MTKIMRYNLILSLKRTELIAVKKGLGDSIMTFYRREILSLQDEGNSNQKICDSIEEKTNEYINCSQISKLAKGNIINNQKIIQYLEEEYLSRAIRESKN